MIDFIVTADVLRSVRRARDHFLALWTLQRLVGEVKMPARLAREITLADQRDDREMYSPDDAGIHPLDDVGIHPLDDRGTRSSKDDMDSPE